MCAKKTAPAIKDLESGDSAKRLKTLLHFFHNTPSPKAVPALVKILKNAKTHTAEVTWASMILEDIGDAAVPELFSLFTDQMADMEHLKGDSGAAAEMMMGTLMSLERVCKKKSAAPDERLVAPAIQMAYDEKERYSMRVLAIKLLGHLGGEEAKKALEELTHHHGHRLEQRGVEDGLAREAGRALDVLNQQTSNRLSEMVPKTAEPAPEAKKRRKRAVR